MKIFTLPAEIEVLALDQISDLIADALCPIESDDAEGLGYQLLRIDVDKEVTQDARAGLLPIRHPRTRYLQTTPTPTADILDRLFQPTPFDVRYGVVLVADAAAYVAERGITLLVQTTDQTEAVKPASDAPAKTPATPAPVAVVALGEPDKAGPKFSMTKAAMVAQHTHEWPTLERDMTDASTNGLAAAKAGPRGWYEPDAMEWARANNKLENTSKSASSLTQAMNSMGNLSGRKHTLEG